GFQFSQLFDPTSQEVTGSTDSDGTDGHPVSTGTLLAPIASLAAAATPSRETVAAESAADCVATGTCPAPALPDLDVRPGETRYLCGDEHYNTVVIDGTVRVGTDPHSKAPCPDDVSPNDSTPDRSSTLSITANSIRINGVIDADGVTTEIPGGLQ